MCINHKRIAYFFLILINLWSKKKKINIFIAIYPEIKNIKNH